MKPNSWEYGRNHSIYGFMHFIVHSKTYGRETSEWNEYVKFCGKSIRLYMKIDGSGMLK